MKIINIFCFRVMMNKASHQNSFHEVLMLMQHIQVHNNKILQNFWKERGRGGAASSKCLVKQENFTSEFIIFTSIYYILLKSGDGSNFMIFPFSICKFKKIVCCEKQKMGWGHALSPPHPPPHPRGYVPVQRAGLISQENPSYINKPISQDRHFLASTTFFKYI